MGCRFFFFSFFFKTRHECRQTVHSSMQPACLPACLPACVPACLMASVPCTELVGRRPAVPPPPRIASVPLPHRQRHRCCAHVRRSQGGSDGIIPPPVRVATSVAAADISVCCEEGAGCVSTVRGKQFFWLSTFSLGADVVRSVISVIAFHGPRRRLASGIHARSCL